MGGGEHGRRANGIYVKYTMLGGSGGIISQKDDQIRGFRSYLAAETIYFSVKYWGWGGSHSVSGQFLKCIAKKNDACNTEPLRVWLLQNYTVKQVLLPKKFRRESPPVLKGSKYSAYG